MGIYGNLWKNKFFKKINVKYSFLNYNIWYKKKTNTYMLLFFKFYHSMKKKLKSVFTTNIFKKSKILKSNYSKI